MKLGIIFQKHVRPYNSGDKAGFEEAEARDFVKRELAIWDPRLNPDGKHLPHEDLPPEIRAHREAIHAADIEQGRIPKGTPFPGTAKAEAVPEKAQMIEKGGGKGGK